MIVQFVNRQSKFSIVKWRLLLSRVLPVALASTSVGSQLIRQGIDTSVSVTFAGPRVMRAINTETRQIDSLTDVLSFPMLEMTDGQMVNKPGIEDFDPAYPEHPTVFLGDMVISLDRAISQAEEFGHSQERETAFLAVHGILHILGYDHTDETREKRMLRKQKQIMDLIGIRRGDQHE